MSARFKFPKSGRVAECRVRMAVAIGAALLTVLAACTSKREAYRSLPSTLKTAVWRTRDTQGNELEKFTTPEWSLLPELREKENLGIAASGGGSRASVAALGQFRALKALGLLDRARYVSSVSGGTWFCGPYLYASPALVPQDANHPHAARMRRMTQAQYDRAFLGEYREPRDLDVSAFLETPEGSYVHAVSRMDMRYPALFRGDGSESYSRVMREAFLQPFGLGAPDKSFTWTRKWFQNHVAPMQQCGLTEDCFYFAVPGRPFLIMNEAITFPSRATTLDRVGFLLRNYFCPKTVEDAAAFHPVETTPLYTGMRTYAAAESRREKPAGGGYVETFAYGSQFRHWESATNRSRAVVAPASQSPTLPPALFSLGDAVGNSGAAVAAAVGGLSGLMNLEPRHWHWPPSDDDPKSREKRLPHVDGGACDNSGIISLLARRSSRIISLSNAIFRLPRNGGRGEIMPWDLPTDVTALFGAPGSTMLLNIVGQHRSNQVLDRVLPDGRDALEDLAQEISARNVTGRPWVVCREYRTIANSRHAIRGGQRVKICWVFLTFSCLHDLKKAGPNSDHTIIRRWISLLPPEPRRIFSDQKELKKSGLLYFPHYDIIQENDRPQQLSAVQANALAQFAAFCVMEAGPEIKAHFGL